MKIGQELAVLSLQVIQAYFEEHLPQAYAAIQEAYLLFHQGKAINPPSHFLWYNDATKSRIIGLAAHLQKPESMPGLKWISSCPNNLTLHLPRASGVIILNDFETGYPVAVLEGAYISSLRTALSALLALEHLHAGKHIRHLGIVGCGVIAAQLLKCAQILGWTIEQLFVFDQDPARSQVFLEKHSQFLSKDVPHLNALLNETDVIILTTTVTAPYITDPQVFRKGTTILNLSLRDLSPEVILSAYNIVDDIEHVLHAHTAPHLAFLKCKHKNFIAGSLAQLLDKSLKVKSGSLKIFSPMGMGILDIALANQIFTDMLQTDTVLQIPDFFTAPRSQ